MATITVTKGYNNPTGWTSGETVTPAKLNSAQTPTVAISDIVNADIATGAAIAGSKLADGAITNVKVDASAAIAHSKLANITAGQVLLGNASNVPTATALSGDVTVTSSGVTSIGSSKVLTAMVNDAAITQAKVASGVAGTGPAFRAYANSTTSVNSSTHTKVTLAAEDFDTNNNFASSRFTPTVAGYYQINAALTVNATALALAALIYKNGTVHTVGSQINTGSYVSLASDIIYLNGTTDYVELYAFHGAGSPRTVADSQTATYLSGSLVRAA